MKDVGDLSFASQAAIFVLVSATVFGGITLLFVGLNKLTIRDADLKYIESIREKLIPYCLENKDMTYSCLYSYKDTDSIITIVDKPFIKERP